MTNLIGQNLGPYRILEQIGKGGMATVFKAYQPSMDRDVAIKVLPSHFMQDPTFVERFDREARIIARLEHPHILPVHDYGKTEEGITYIVMRYVEAGTLADLLKKKKFTIDETIKYFDKIADALAYAHEQGVLHRDIKPSNVLVDPRGQTFLTDFGLAGMTEGSTGLTGSMILGTPAYMAPELGEGQAADKRSEIYALGIVLYEMMTGRPPFEAETPLAIMIKHMSEPLPLPRELNPNIPESIERVILKALAKDAESRYQTIPEMINALHQANRQAIATSPTQFVSKPATPKPEPTPTSSVKRPIWVWAVAAIIILLIIASGLFFFFSKDSSNDNEETITQVTPTEAITPQPSTDNVIESTSMPTNEADADIDYDINEADADIDYDINEEQEEMGPWTHFSNTSNVKAIAIQEDTIWAGTEGGLVIWDVENDYYEKYGTLEGLHYPNISALLVASDGSIWIGTHGDGIMQMTDDEWKVFTTEDGLTSNIITAFFEKEDGGILAATAEGSKIVSYFDGTRWQAADLPPLPDGIGQYPIALLQNTPQTLVVGLANSGVLYFDGEDWLHFNTENGLPSNDITSISHIADTKFLLTADQRGAIGFFDGEDFETKAELSDVLATASYVAPDGTIWVGAYEALWYFTEEELGHYDKNDGLPPGRINTIVGDEYGLLLGIEGQGLVWFDDETFEIMAFENEPAFNNARQIIEIEENQLWFIHQWGSETIAVYNIENDTWDTIETPGRTQAVAIDNDGYTWLGTTEGLWRVSEEEEYHFTIEDDLPGDEITTLAFDENNNHLWVGSTTGLAYLDLNNDEPVVVYKTHDISNPNIAALYVDSQDNIWIGTQQPENSSTPASIILASEGSIENEWIAGKDLPDSIAVVTSFVSDTDECIWAGTWGSGVLQFDCLEEDTWIEYFTESEDFLGEVLNITATPDGAIWLGTWYKGLWRFDPKEEYFEHLTPNAGLPGMAVFATYVDSNGFLWLSTESGIAQFETEYEY